MGVVSKLVGRSEEEELKKYIVTMNRLLQDEDYQNSFAPKFFAHGMPGPGPLVCETLPGATGEFGYSVTNPIPVNGPIGEIAYVSSLKTIGGEGLLFHRIGSTNQRDVFEAVTFSGSAWFILFLDMYHTKKSHHAPAGFRLDSRPCQFSGFHNRCDDFPYDFEKVKHAQSDAILPGYIPVSLVIEQIRGRAYARPLAHKAKLSLCFRA